MLEQRESYISPVGFATEPAGQWRKWAGRLMVFVLVLGIGWMLVNRVVRTSDDQPSMPVPELPGPI